MKSDSEEFKFWLGVSLEAIFRPKFSMERGSNQLENLFQVTRRLRPQTLARLHFGFSADLKKHQTNGAAVGESISSFIKNCFFLFNNLGLGESSASDNGKHCCDPKTKFHQMIMK